MGEADREGGRALVAGLAFDRGDEGVEGIGGHSVLGRFFLQEKKRKGASITQAGKLRNKGSRNTPLLFFSCELNHGSNVRLSQVPRSLDPRHACKVRRAGSAIRQALVLVP